jgi:hypothetical protein
MKQAASANLEMTVVLPLGVIANQLIRIEADLRLLNMKALILAQEADKQHPAGRVEATLEIINEALDSIRSLVSGIEGHIHGGAPTAVSATRSSPEAVYRKPHPEQDD